MSLATILIVLLIIALIGGLPGWGYHTAGYGPSGIIGLVLVVLLVLVLLGRV